MIMLLYIKKKVETHVLKFISADKSSVGHQFYRNRPYPELKNFFSLLQFDVNTTLNSNNFL